MSESTPEVSVVIPTRNRVALLPETVRSITEQSGVKWELLIVNDRSTDGTAAYLESLRDPRIRGLPNSGRQGQSGACNYGLDQVRGEFVMFMDDDDLLRPGGLAKLVTALRRHASAVAVAGARYDWFCDARGGGRRDSHPFFTRVRDMFADLLFGWSAVSAQNIYRTEVARRVGGFNPEIYNVQDRDFWLRVAREGPVVLLPDVVMNYRVHAGQSKPPNVEQLRERVFRMAIRRLPRERRRRALRIRASSRLIQAAESALADGRLSHAAGLIGRASRVWPGMWTSPVLGPWVARRLARRVWHRLCGHRRSANCYVSGQRDTVMRVLLQHPHRPDEISGVMTYCEATRDALKPLGVEAVIQSTHGLTWRDAWRAVQKVDLVHLNSNHVGLTLAARMQGKPILIKYHYPFWDEMVEGDHEPMSFLRRCGRDTLFNWRSSIGRPLLGRLRFNAERLARSVLRVFVASMMDTRLGCSEFIARTTDLPWKTELDYNPFAFPEHAPKEATAITTRPGFVFAGRLHRTKGVDVLLDAAAILARRGHTFRVDIIGKGEEEENLPALAKRLGLDSTVRFWGHLPHDYTMDLMRQSLAIVVPSRWNDPAPYVIVETAAVGRPAIGARRGGIPELIGADGLFFDSEDAEGLATQMEMLLTQPGESTRRGGAALAALRKLCDEKVAARRLVKFYENLIHADLIAPATHEATAHAK